MTHDIAVVVDQAYAAGHADGTRDALTQAADAAKKKVLEGDYDPWDWGEVSDWLRARAEEVAS